MKYLSKQLLIFLILICTACSHSKSSHTMYSISQVDSKLYADSLALVELFVKALNERNFHSTTFILNQTEMTFDGTRYIPSPIFIDTCIRLIGDMNIFLTSSKSYSFDDVFYNAQNLDIKPLAVKMFRVFDSNSMLVVSELEFYNHVTRNVKQFLFVVSRDDSGYPQIDAIYGFDNQPQQTENFELNYEILYQFGICINIPKDFTEQKIDPKLIGYYLKDESSYNTSFQIFAVKSKDIKGEAMKYIKEIIKKRSFHNFTIRYIPNGYRFQFYTRDSSDNIRIIKVNAIRHKNKIIFITFSANMQTYNSRRVEINYCLDNVDLF